MSATGESIAVIEGHSAVLYGAPHQLAATVSPFLVGALDAGEPVMVAATSAHRAAIDRSLREAGVDLDGAVRAGRVVSLDADDVVARVVRDGRVDRAAFDDIVGGAVAAVCGAAGATPRVFGELVGVLWNRGDVPAALELEDLWNELATHHAFVLLCGYQLDADEPLARGRSTFEVCNRHAAVLRLADDARSPAVERWRRFDASAVSPRAARRFVVDAVCEWGRHDVEDDAALVVTELATNAVLHARTTFHVVVALRDDRVRIEVHDLGPGIPSRTRVTAGSATGRGLNLVGAMAMEWGADVAPGRKVVWAELG